LSANVAVDVRLPPEHATRSVVVELEPRGSGTFVVELLGPNRKPVAKRQVTLAGPGKVTFAMPRALGGVHVSAGDSHAWLDCRNMMELVMCDEHRLPD
jgi:hypothetical protein